MIDIHYFASVREAMQRSNEQLALPENVNKNGELIKEWEEVNMNERLDSLINHGFTKNYHFWHVE